MRLEDVQQLLQRQCDKAGGQIRFALSHGFTRQYIWLVLDGQRPPSAKLCKALGIRSDGERWVKT